MNKKIKVLLFVFLLAMIFAGAQFSDRLQSLISSGPQPMIILDTLEQEGFPPIEQKDIQGRAMPWEKFEDKVVLVHFWAAWCDPCVDEFPEIIELVKKFKGQVIVVAVSADYEQQDITEFVKAFPKPNPDHFWLLWDELGELRKKYGVQTLPETFVVHKGDRLVHKVLGSEKWTNPESTAFFKKLLEMP